MDLSKSLEKITLYKILLKTSFSAFLPNFGNISAKCRIRQSVVSAKCLFGKVVFGEVLHFKCNLLAQRHSMATQRVRPLLSRKLKLNIPVVPHPRCCHPSQESQLGTCCGLLHLSEHTTVDMPTI